jgi:hypothetical protein
MPPTPMPGFDANTYDPLSSSDIFDDNLHNDFTSSDPLDEYTKHLLEAAPSSPAVQRAALGLSLGVVLGGLAICAVLFLYPRISASIRRRAIPASSWYTNPATVSPADGSVIQDIEPQTQQQQTTSKPKWWIPAILATHFSLRGAESSHNEVLTGDGRPTRTQREASRAQVLEMLRLDRQRDWIGVEAAPRAPPPAYPLVPTLSRHRPSPYAGPYSAPDVDSGSDSTERWIRQSRHLTIRNPNKRSAQDLQLQEPDTAAQAPTNAVGRVRRMRETYGIRRADTWSESSRPPSYTTLHRSGSDGSNRTTTIQKSGSHSSSRTRTVEDDGFEVVMPETR